MRCVYLLVTVQLSNTKISHYILIFILYLLFNHSLHQELDFSEIWYHWNECSAANVETVTYLDVVFQSVWQMTGITISLNYLNYPSNTPVSSLAPQVTSIHSLRINNSRNW